MPPQDPDTILTKHESQLIDDALRQTHRSAAWHKDHVHASVARAVPFGEPGSVQNRLKIDALEAEVALLDNMMASGYNVDRTAKFEKIDSMAIIIELEGKANQQSDPQSQALQAARRMLDAADVKMAAIEDASPQAETFRAIRKVEKGGSVEVPGKK